MIQNNLCPQNHTKLFLILPAHYGEDSDTIDYILEQLNITELIDETFETVYRQVRARLSEDASRGPDRGIWRQP